MKEIIVNNVCQFQVGDIIEVADKIDPENQPTTIATIKYIEPDNEIEGLWWIYLIANEEVLNTNMHPTLGYYWTLVADDDQYIRLLSRATIS
jgi:hypothetical protein